MQSFSRIQTPSIHEVLQRRIEEYILANNLRPGDPLPGEVQMSRELGVSRAMVREALRALESVGVIHLRRGEGRFVSAFNMTPVVDSLRYSMLFDNEDVRDLIEIRERIETAFIGDAIANMNEATIAELQRLVAEMESKTQGREPYLAEDLAFHRAIYDVVENRLLMKLLDAFFEVQRNLVQRNPTLPVGKDFIHTGNHAAILEAIIERNPEHARQSIAEHFARLHSRVSAAPQA